VSDKLANDMKAGEGKWGTAVFYGPYVNYGTRKMGAQPFMSASAEIVRRKAEGTYKREMGIEINKGLRHRFKKMISKDIEFYGTDLDLPIDNGNEKSVNILVAAGVSQAKSMCPVAKVNGGNLKRSIMWKTSKSEGGYGQS